MPCIWNSNQIFSILNLIFLIIGSCQRLSRLIVFHRKCAKRTIFDLYRGDFQEFNQFLPIIKKFLIEIHFT